MRYIVTRQHYWFADEDDPVAVEIALGDKETWNAGALAERYPQDFFTSDDPREIVDAAIRLRTAWRKDLPREQEIVFTFSFNDLCYPSLYEGDTVYDLRRWAEERYAEMDKCEQCGALIGNEKEAWQLVDRWGDDEPKFCREYCVEEYELEEHRQLDAYSCDDPENCFIHCEEVTR